MLKNIKYIKGSLITDVESLKNSSYGLWLEDKRMPNFNSFIIDNPFLDSNINGYEESKIQEWLDRTQNTYYVYSRIKSIRDVIFTSTIDNMLDSMLSTFAVEYMSSEYNQEELMEEFLYKLKEKFNISEVD